MEYRIVTRTIPGSLFRSAETKLILQKYVEVKDFSGYWVTTAMKWVDCNEGDQQAATLALFCKN